MYVKNTLTAKERTRIQALAMLQNVDAWLEGWNEDKSTFDPKGFDLKSHFATQQPSKAHARVMRSIYEHELDDFKELERMPSPGRLNTMDEKEADYWMQLKEGYSHLKKADIRSYTLAIEELLSAIDFIIEQSTSKRNLPKSARVNKSISKLKYRKTDTVYKLTSIEPVEIIGATELWVFNTKTRKIGKYIAINNEVGLQVKGTNIVGYNTATSLQKTLRKPEVQLKDFKESGKVALRTFLDRIPTVDSTLNGRINLDTVLLKVS